MSKPNETAEKIAAIMNEAAHDNSPPILRMAELMLEMNHRQAQLAVEAMDRLQKESQETRALVRDVLFGKLALFNLPTARAYANLPTGRFAVGPSASAGKSSPGGGEPATSDGDEEREVLRDEEILRDINPTGRPGGDGFVPPR